MYLVRLIYASRKAGNSPKIEIENILSSAKKHNPRNAVTGILCFSKDFFLQCLEGSRTAVNETYHRIMKDDRHEDILLIGYEEISSRKFNDWSMGYVPEQSLTKSVIMKYCKSDEFDPYSMSGPSALQILTHLGQTL